MPKILIICTGNVCRSPVVEALLHKRLSAAGRGDWEVDSAGTGHYPQRPASRFSVEVIRETESLDLSMHRSKVVTPAMVSEANLVICMAARHKTQLIADCPAEADKIFLLSEMSSEAAHDVADPYGQDKPAYRAMVETVTQLVDAGFERMVELAQA